MVAASRLRNSVIRDFAVGLFACLAVPIVAQATETDCLNTEVLRDRLAKEQRQTRAAAGIADGNLFEIYADEDGDFTAVVTLPSGISCILGRGEYWQLERSDGPRA